MEKQRHPSRYYKSFYENSPIGLYTTDTVTAEFIMVNPACAKLLGFASPEALLNAHTKSTDFYDEETRNQLIEDLKEHNGVFDYELPISVNGKTKWVAVSASLCEDRECLQGSITDISRRKEMEKEIENLKLSSISMLQKIKENTKGRIEQLKRA